MKQLKKCKCIDPAYLIHMLKDAVGWVSCEKCKGKTKLPGHNVRWSARIVDEFEPEIEIDDLARDL